MSKFHCAFPIREQKNGIFFSEFIQYESRGFLHIAFREGDIVKYDLETNELMVSYKFNGAILNAIPYYA